MISLAMSALFSAYAENAMPYLSLGLGGAHTGVVKSDGSQWTWGNNWNGQLGDGTFKDKLKPVQTKIAL